MTEPDLSLTAYNQPSDPLSAREAANEERREQFSLEEREAMSRRDMAAEATLLFHSGSPWDDAKQIRWHQIAEALLGTKGNIPRSRCYDATTRTLCDMQRAVLAKSK